MNALHKGKFAIRNELGADDFRGWRKHHKQSQSQGQPDQTPKQHLSHGKHHGSDPRIVVAAASHGSLSQIPRPIRIHLEEPLKPIDQQNQHGRIPGTERGKSQNLIPRQGIPNRNRKLILNVLRQGR